MVELAASPPGGLGGSFIPLILMVAIFYFLLIRPQQRRQKQRNAMLGAVKVGDKIVTIGGIHGTIMSLDDGSVQLQIADNIQITIDRQAINQVKASDADTDTDTETLTTT
ncbi:preprotein translocase subunit YajC [Ammoniphilus oxalaticus]|uniref:Preprotein translocase subunit YajC n=1 Tax=Ammoniphilus oxalaticus TaxID=66863 RepID=A0A419SIU1_9BACL|nr:preprotein translocase subunit YajC [Ammoniphilus oxalaticus]RKD23923.1 preprotein translocase subunit YajC [Ammoniphilus oxalaticus]